MKKFRYFIQAVIVYFFYYLFLLIGIDSASYIAGKISRFLGPLISKNKIAIRNLKYVMPELSNDEIKNITKDMWENLGRVVGEMPHIYNMKNDEFFRRVKLNNPEEINRIKSQESPVIFFSGHFANWEIIPKTAHELGLPAKFVYRHANNPWVNNLIQKARKEVAENTFAKGRGAAKETISVLKGGGMLGLLVDQKMNDGIETKFFGKRAMSPPLIGQLAKKTNSLVFPVLVKRTKGAYFEISLGEQLILDDKSPEEITQNINDTLEEWIRKNPSQWMWVHNRWPKEDVA